jgi:ribosomal protein S18 acetylase RimI-like enzyme
VPDIKPLAPDDWRTLRKIRLSALADSPHAFISTYAQEQAYSEQEWRAEFNRGDWYAGIAGGEPVSLAGVTREPGKPLSQCFLEYIWVSPDFRCQGVAFRMLSQVLERLRESGIRTVFLWVLDGNDGATRLYKRLGFVSCNYSQPLEAYPGRCEELMQLDFG